MSRRAVAGLLAAAVVTTAAACTSPVSIGGAEGDGPREDDTAALLELPGVEHALVSTDPVEDSDYSVTRAVVDLAPDADVEQVAAVLEALAEMDAVDGRTWVTVGAGRAELDEYGDLVPPVDPVPIVQGRLEDPDSADRVATALVEGSELVGTPARVTPGDDGIALEVSVDGDVAALAQAGLRLSQASYAQADRVSVFGEGTLRLASGDPQVDARAVAALVELVDLQRRPPRLPTWVSAWPPIVGTEYDRVSLESELDVGDLAPSRVPPRDRRAVLRWIEGQVEVAARLPPGSDLSMSSRADTGSEPLDLFATVYVPDPGDRPTRRRTGDPWQDAASAHLAELLGSAQKPRARRTS